MNEDFKKFCESTGLSNDEILRQVLVGLATRMSEEDFTQICGKLCAHLKEKQNEQPR